MNQQEYLPAICVGLALLLAATAWKPWYNWDLVAYIGAVYAHTESDLQVVHARAYEDTRRHVPAPDYTEIIGQGSAGKSPPWRARLAEEPRAFAQFLPAFQVKPVYPMLMSILGTAGMDLVTASVFLSKAAYWLTGLLLYYWLSIYLRPWMACLFATLVMLSPPAVILARLSSPDALSTLIALAVLFLLTERGNGYRVALLLAVLSVLVRHNNLLLLLFAALLISWRSPGVAAHRPGLLDNRPGDLSGHEKPVRQLQLGDVFLPYGGGAPGLSGRVQIAFSHAGLRPCLPGLCALGGSLCLAMVVAAAGPADPV